MDADLWVPAISYGCLVGASGNQWVYELDVLWVLALAQAQTPDR